MAGKKKKERKKVGLYLVLSMFLINVSLRLNPSKYK